MNITALLKRVIAYGAILAGAVAIVGAIAGLLTDGTRGLTSALLGAIFAFVFLAITAVSILAARKVTGDDFLNPAFFIIVLGGWLLKFVVFLVLLILIKDQAWINTVAFFLAIVASVIGSLVIDVVVVARSRMPYVDVKLPGDDDAASNDNRITP